MHMHRIAGGCLGGLEAEVIVPVRALRFAARAHLIDLRGHLVVGTEPRGRCRRNCRIRVISSKAFGVAKTVLLQRIPDPVIRTGGCEMIALARPLRALIFDKMLEHLCRTINGGGVCIGPFETDHTCADAQHPRPFRHQFGIGQVKRRDIIHRHIILNVRGKRHICGGQLLLDQSLKRLNIAAVNQIIARVHGAAPYYASMSRPERLQIDTM